MLCLCSDVTWTELLHINLCLETEATSVRTQTLHVYDKSLPWKQYETVEANVPNRLKVIH